MTHPEGLVYVVEWTDSAFLSEWHDAEDYGATLLCTTVGYLVHDEDEFIFVASTRDANGRWCGGMAIPRTAIASMKLWNPDAVTA